MICEMSDELRVALPKEANIATHDESSADVEFAVY